MEFLWMVILTFTEQVVLPELLVQERPLSLLIELKVTNGDKLMISSTPQFQIEKLINSALLKFKWMKFLIKFNNLNGSVWIMKDKKTLETKKFKKWRLNNLELSLKNNNKEESMILTNKKNRLSDIKWRRKCKKLGGKLFIQILYKTTT